MMRKEILQDLDMDDRAAVSGVAQSQTRLKQLSSSSRPNPSPILDNDVPASQCSTRTGGCLSPIQGRVKFRQQPLLFHQLSRSS